MTLNGDGNSAQSIINFSSADMPKADLEVGKVEYTFQNGILHFTNFEIRNLGNEASTGSEVKIFLGNDRRGVTNTFSIPSISAGESYTDLPFDIDLYEIGAPQDGIYRLEVTADLLKQVTEGKEDNNFKLVSSDVSKNLIASTNLTEEGREVSLNLINSNFEVYTQGGNIDLSLFDIKGNLVKVYANGSISKGLQSYNSGLSTLNPGTYICKLTSNSKVVTKKVVLAEK